MGCRVPGGVYWLSIAAGHNSGFSLHRLPLRHARVRRRPHCGTDDLLTGESRNETREAVEGIEVRWGM
jgi:hypothetical protein